MLCIMPLIKMCVYIFRVSIKTTVKYFVEVLLFLFILDVFSILKLCFYRKIKFSLNVQLQCYNSHQLCDQLSWELCKAFMCKKIRLWSTQTVNVSSVIGEIVLKFLMLILRQPFGKGVGCCVHQSISIFASFGRQWNFKFTVTVFLMNLFIYLVVALKAAMNLLCLERNVSIHSLSPYLVSFHSESRYLECPCYHHHVGCLPLGCYYG